ncbi:MAG: O-antigen ligase family protein [Planctomycetes bacterium]|nr:O-antigen ligase family protein [Planctomycetota bacterium]
MVFINSFAPSCLRGNLSFFVIMKLSVVTLLLLVAAFVLSPKIALSAGSGIFLRADDIIILGILAYWLISRRKVYRPSVTGLDVPIFIFFIVIMLSGILGILRGTAGNSFLPVLYTLKMAEYAVGFYFAASIVKSSEDISVLLDGFLIIAGIVCVIGMGEWFWAYHTGRVESADQWYRIFNNAVYPNDANHIAGFLVTAMALAFCRLFMFEKGIWPRMRTAFLLAMIVVTIGLTLSRSGMIASGVACIVAALFMPFRAKAAIALIACCVVLLVLAGSVLAKERSGIFSEYDDYMKSRENMEDGYWQEYSAARNRFEAWDALVRETVQFPVSGAGLGARGRYAYESQYFYMLGEAGLMGLAAFLYLLWKIWKTALYGVHESRSQGVESREPVPESREPRAECWPPDSGPLNPEPGTRNPDFEPRTSDNVLPFSFFLFPPSYIFPAFAGAIAGMAIMSFTSEAFLITRIAGPFWVLAGIAVAMSGQVKSSES